MTEETMNRNPRIDRNYSLALFALSALATLALARPAMAAADGLPHLDPTNNNNGTVYSFSMPGITKSMDPALAGAQFHWKGEMRVFQDFGSSDFDVEMDLDVNGDSVTD